VIKKAVIFALSFGFCLTSMAQNIYVHTNDGATYVSPLIDVNSITFEENEMRLNLVSADTISWNFSSVAFLEYDQWYVSVPDGLILDAAGMKVYPNPSSEIVNVSYTLLADSEVSVEIYDLKGSLIYELFKGGQIAGEQRLVWNIGETGNVINGAYLCKVQMGVSLFHKLIIISR
jgi:hypothetical protein